MMGLTGEDLRNATIIPAGCVFVIGLSVLTCCCLRCKNRNEELERRRNLEKTRKPTNPNKSANIRHDQLNVTSTQTNLHTNGGAEFRTFSEIPFNDHVAADQTINEMLMINNGKRKTNKSQDSYTPTVQSVENGHNQPDEGGCRPASSSSTLVEVRTDKHYREPIYENVPSTPIGATYNTKL